MSTRIRVNIPAGQILNRRGLADGSAQRKFVHEVRRQMDPYVPLKSGVLKNSAQETENAIIYDTPYARRQYYENRGRGLRGRQWDKRMLADRREALVRFVEALMGGRV